MPRLPALFCLLATPLWAATELELSTNLPWRSAHPPALAVDGDPATGFASNRPAVDGDDWQLALPKGTRGSRVEVQTGAPDGEGALAQGVLELSDDGVNFRPAAIFTNGVAAAVAPQGFSVLRLRVTAGSGRPLFIREVKLDGVEGPLSIRLFPRVFTHLETAPEAAEFAAKAKRIVEEWYPRLVRDFDHPGAPAPRPEIHLYFQNMPGVAHAVNGGIHISAEWVSKKSPQDFGMVVHELFHIVQDYRGGGEGWLTEGLADYVRHRFFEPTTPLGPPDPDKASYRDAYRTTARFLIWCEQKWPGLAARLNEASRKRQPVRPLFAAAAGKELDALWSDYVADRTWSFPARPR